MPTSTNSKPNYSSAQSGRVRAPSLSLEETDRALLEDEALMPSPTEERVPIFARLGLDCGPRICTPQNTPMFLVESQQATTTAPAVAGILTKGGLKTVGAMPKKRLPVDKVADTHETSKRVKSSAGHNDDKALAAAACDKEATAKRGEEHLPPKPSPAPAPAPAPQQALGPLPICGNRVFESVELNVGSWRAKEIDTVHRNINCKVLQGRVRVTLCNPLLSVFEVDEGEYFELQEGDLCTVINAVNPGETAVVDLDGRMLPGHRWYNLDYQWSEEDKQGRIDYYNYIENLRNEW